ncbi:MAG TPA: ROK family protein [Nocardioidaceae bacterium]|nr:ROK family protein [Nocardioidaceae bacterium]
MAVRNELRTGAGMSLRRVPATPASAGEVFRLIHDDVANTRSEIGRQTGLSRTAVVARLSALIGHGLVVETDSGPSTGGRPPSRVRFNAAGGVVLAAAIGRSRTQLAVCDLAGEPLIERNIDREVGAGPNVLMTLVAAALADMLETTDRPAGAVRGIGVSLPGTVDIARGCSLSAPAMSGWDGVPLAPYLSAPCLGAPYVGGLGDAPVYVDNDVNVMVLSERRGHLRRFSDVLLVKASTGIGAGLVAGGVLLRGGLGAAGEIGHTRVPDAGGVRCRCGQVDCAETVAAGWALVRALQEAGRPVSHIRDVVSMATAGDAEAVRLIREAGRRLGEVIAGAVNLLNPQALIIGGDMALAYDPLVAGLRETVYANSAALSTRDLQILPATWGQRSGVIGCSAMVLDAVLSPPAVDAALVG